MTNRVLVAGCGDVGMRVARQLRQRGELVTGLRRSLPGGGVDFPLHAADLTAPASLRGLPDDIARIVYLPAPAARTEPAYRAIFVEGLRHLLEAVDTRKLERIVFVSSSAVYGDHGGARVDEATPPDPPGFRGRVLLQAERWLAAQGLPATVLRLAGLYGPGRTRLFERLRAGEVRVPRDKPFWSHRIHVDDAASAIVHLLYLRQAGPLYVGVDDIPLPLDVLYDHLAGLLGVPAPAEGPPPPGIGNKRLDNARLRRSGWQPRWPDAREGYAALLLDPVRTMPK